jgi:GNAT superfamily N-acetyltransferase
MLHRYLSSRGVGTYMTALERLTYLRACAPSDDAFLYDVFATTWESEVAALPNQNLARHVLRIQHIAQERRFAGRYPGYERFVILEQGEPAGRLYLHDSGLTMHVVDLTLMPQFRSQGIGSRIFHDLFDVAASEGRSVTVQVGRRNRQATDLATRLGFRLATVDDLDHYFEWMSPSDMKEDFRDMKEDLQGMKETEQHAVRTAAHLGVQR